MGDFISSAMPGLALRSTPKPEGFMTIGPPTAGATRFSVAKLPTPEQIDALRETFGIHIEPASKEH